MRYFFLIIRYFFTVLIYLLSVSAIVGILYFEGLFGLITLVSIVAMSMVFASIFRILFARVKSSPFLRVSWRTFLGISSVVGACVAIFAGFIYYNNNINPASLSNVVLQNDAGQKVVFVKMSHIATPQFYEKKRESLLQLFHENFLILVEGVEKSDNSETNQQLDAMMGFDFSRLGYSEFANISGLISQNNALLYADIDEKNLKNVDVRAADILSHMEKNPLPKMNSSVSQAEYYQQVMQSVQKLNERQMFVIQKFFTSLFNFLARNEEEFLTIIEQEKGNHQEMQFLSVILHERNKPIIDEILHNPEKNYAVVYGGLHFDGVFAGLKEKDDSWRIVDIVPFFPYSQD